MVVKVHICVSSPFVFNVHGFIAPVHGKVFSCLHMICVKVCITVCILGALKVEFES